MSVSRRGFLQTLAASLVGAATFDPKALLWVPARPTQIIQVTGDAQQAALAMEQAAELNELAFRLARMMTERLARHPSLALREVMYRHSGSVHLPPDTLEIPEEGLGRFEPMATRIMPTHHLSQGYKPRDLLEGLAFNLTDSIFHVGRQIDMFAPVGVELRPGEPFTEDVAIGVGTDPESGLSVRVLRFEMDRRRGTQLMLGAEMAGGRWRNHREVNKERLKGTRVERERRVYPYLGERNYRNS